LRAWPAAATGSEICKARARAMPVFAWIGFMEVVKVGGVIEVWDEI
jgi:hypothetical protein